LSTKGRTAAPAAIAFSLLVVASKPCQLLPVRASVNQSFKRILKQRLALRLAAGQVSVTFGFGDGYLTTKKVRFVGQS